MNDESKSEIRLRVGVRVVISKGWNHANLAVLSLIAHGWGVRNAQDHSPTQTWTRVLPVQRPYISRSHANNQNNTRNARAPHSEGTANNDAHHRAHLSKNVSEPPKIMHSSPGHHKRSHQTCTVAHDKEQPDSALWPGHSLHRHTVRQGLSRPPHSSKNAVLSWFSPKSCPLHVFQQF